MTIKNFGQTDLEKRVKELAQCRDIVKVIMDFGVSQRQIARIVNLLSLELLDPEHMTQIRDASKIIEAAMDESTDHDQLLIR